MTDVTDFLNMTPDETPDPVELTDGVYEFVIVGARTDHVGENNTARKRLTLKADAVIDADFPPDDLPQADAVRLDFFMTEKSLKVNNPTISAKQFLTRVLE